jgi:glutamine amidotransferase
VTAPPPTPVVIVRTGSANLASVCAALDRLAQPWSLSIDPDEVRRADRVILPGVGAFGAAMSALRDARLVEPLRQRLFELRPTLCVCLGLQLLFEGSDESPGVEGLSVLNGRAARFAPTPTAVRVPQLGWNNVEPDASCRLLQPGFAFYANSFRVALDSAPTGWAAATTDYAGRFIGALERGPVLACQFHPELSGPWGAALLRRWLDTARVPAEGAAC